MTSHAARGIPATPNQRVVPCLLYFGLWIIAETLLIFGPEAPQIGRGRTSALRSLPGEGFSCLLGWNLPSLSAERFSTALHLK